MLKTIMRYFTKIVRYTIITCIILLLIKLFFEIYLLESYSNHYITKRVYISNMQYFNEIASKLSTDSSNLWYYTEEKCSYSSDIQDQYNRVPYYCKYKFHPSHEFEIKMEEIWIMKITKENYYNRDRYGLSFQINKKTYTLQDRHPEIRYSSRWIYRTFSRMFPYPISNRYLYIWSLVYDIDEHWRISCIINDEEW